MEDNFLHKGLRKKLVEEIKQKGIKDQKVLDAINKVPRHLFMDSSFTKFAYKDQAFPIGSGQTISQPYTVAFQTELLELKKMESFFLLGLDSEIDTIINRIKKRNRKTDIAENQELKKRLDREWGLGEPQYGQHVGKCMDMADFVVDNNESLEELKTKIFNILKLIGEKNGK